MSPPTALSRQAFADHIPEILDALIDAVRALEEGKTISSRFQRLFTNHGEERWRQGFDLNGVARDWNHLRSVLQEQMLGYYDEALKASVPLRTALETCTELINEGIHRSIASFDRLRSVEAESRIQDLGEALTYLRSQFVDRSKEMAESSHDLKGSTDLMLVLSDEITRDLDEYLPAKRRERIHNLFASLKVGLTFNLRLIEEMLLIARLEAGRDGPQVEKFNLSPLVESVAEHFRPFAAARAVSIRLHGPDHLDIASDSMKLSRILHNLISNAMKYTAEGTVMVHWEAIDSKRWELTVADNGNTLGGRPEVALDQQSRSGGNPAEVEIAPDLDPDGERGVDRGYPPPRGERMSDTSDPILQRRHLFGDSNGLGLSIVKRLCEILDGSFYLHTEHGEGVRVRIVFPIDLKV